jgi:hypothetical protein
LHQLKTFFPALGHARVDEKTLPDGTLEISFSKQVTRKGSHCLESNHEQFPCHR